jgi:hypothetical protein
MLVTATVPPGGTVLIDDTADVAAITALTSGIALQTAMIEKQFGTLWPTASPGGLSAQAAITASNTGVMLSKFDDLKTQLEALTTAVGSVSNQQERVLTALANIQWNMTKSNTIQAMAYSDQVRNNKFQQKATNQALADAGKDPIVVKEDEFITAAKQSLTDTASVNAQVAATSVVQDFVTESLTKGIEISQQWILQSAFGKWIASYYAEAKIQTQLLYADEKTKRVLETQLASLKAARLSPATAK